MIVDLNRSGVEVDLVGIAEPVEPSSAIDVV
jgi:hypothetical protein